MANINDVIRRASGYVDTSGAMPPAGIQMAAFQGGGVYTQVSDTAKGASDLTVGRIGLGTIAILILAAMGFYYWTRSIQGGG
jgi:hypothetical protein